MVDISKIDITFRQSCNSCVLASYGIVSNYYTQIPVRNYFEAYCRHHCIHDNEDIYDACSRSGFIMVEFNKYECLYDYLFQQELKKGTRQGLEIIKDLHNLSDESEFADARKLFGVQFIPDAKKDTARIEKILIGYDSLLICSFRVNQKGAHITTIGYDEKRKWFDRNTAQSAVEIKFFNSIAAYIQSNDGLDGLLAIRK